METFGAIVNQYSTETVLGGGINPVWTEKHGNKLTIPVPMHVTYFTVKLLDKDILATEMIGSELFYLDTIDEEKAKSEAGYNVELHLLDTYNIPAGVLNFTVQRDMDNKLVITINHAHDLTDMDNKLQEVADAKRDPTVYISIIVAVILLFHCWCGILYHHRRMVVD